MNAKLDKILDLLEKLNNQEICNVVVAARDIHKSFAFPLASVAQLTELACKLNLDEHLKKKTGNNIVL